MKVNRLRKGRSLITTFSDVHGSCESSSTWCEYDDLDTKTVDLAKDNYEKVFVLIRDKLEENGYDDQNDRLSLTQSLADLLRQNCLIRKEGP